jgi:tetratricopeptide (TPR) repeat protein
MSALEPNEAPLPRRLGAYWLEAEIGRGAMGVVYRARHLDGGDVVALKTLPGPDASLHASLRRELLALQRIEHPGVVSVVEHGHDGGVPWYAMELIEGVPLDRVGSLRVDRPDVLHILLRFCNTLAFLHDRGIVHRDLKPSNVLVRPTGEPVVVDFGLTGRFGGKASREPLEAGGEVVGTLAYLAPEQASGDDVDARADLYAFGCILYELATGRVPFDGSAWAILQAHLRTPPPSPATLAPDLGPALEALVLSLLEKDPRRRMPYAVDVATALTALLPEDERPPASASPRYLYRPRFSGRSDELQRLDERLAVAQDRGGSLALIHGESGVGKTRLAMEATRLAAERGFRVLACECMPVEGRGPSGFLAAPLHPLRPLLRAVADECIQGGPEVTGELLADRASLLAAHEDTLRQVPGFEALPQPPDLPAEEARGRLVADLFATVRALALRSPLLLVIDDLQWGDEVTVAFLAELAHAPLDDVPLVVLGTYRSEEARDAVRNVAHAPRVASFALGRVDPATVDGIVADMLALPVAPRPLVHFLEDASEGNPFFVAEYLRAAVEAGLLWRDASGAWQAGSEGGGVRRYASLGLPSGLRELLLRRTSHLDPETERVLECAAVLGRSFSTDMLRALSGLAEDSLFAALSELLRREILQDAPGGRYHFSHDQVREVAYDRIDPDRRRSLHRATAALREAELAAGSGTDDLVSVLAHHWSEAGVAEKALDYLERAGIASLRAGAPADARASFERALELDGRSDRDTDALQRARWYRLLGEAKAGTGDLDGAIESTVVGLDELGRGLPTSRGSWLRALLLESMHYGLRRLVTGGGPRREAEADREAALASGRVATNHYFAFELVEGAVCSLRCVNLAERGGAPGLAALSYAQLGYLAGGLRLHRLAGQLFERSRAVGDVADPSAYAASLYFRAMYETGLGAWKRSVELAEASSENLARVGNQQEFEIAETVLANAYYFEGRLEESDARCHVLYDSAQRRANTQHMGWGLFLSGRAQLALGNVEAAYERLEEGYALVAETGDVVSTVICEGLLSRASLGLGHGGRARELADRLSARRADSVRRVVPLVQCLDGYRSIADVYWIEATRATEPVVRDTLERKLEEAVQDLRIFARLFPIARSAAQRARARVDWSAGRLARARRAWERALLAARQFSMPYDEMLAALDLAEADASAEARARHRQRAVEIAARLGIRSIALHAGLGIRGIAPHAGPGP